MSFFTNPLYDRNITGLIRYFTLPSFTADIIENLEEFNLDYRVKTMPLQEQTKQTEILLREPLPVVMTTDSFYYRLFLYFVYNHYHWLIDTNVEMECKINARHPKELVYSLMIRAPENEIPEPYLSDFQSQTGSIFNSELGTDFDTEPDLFYKSMSLQNYLIIRSGVQLNDELETLIQFLLYFYTIPRFTTTFRDTKIYVESHYFQQEDPEFQEGLETLTMIVFYTDIGFRETSDHRLVYVNAEERLRRLNILYLHLTGIVAYYIQSQFDTLQIEHIDHYTTLLTVDDRSLIYIEIRPSILQSAF